MAFNFGDFQDIILKKIKLLIKEKFKTQKEFANHFDLTEQTITNWFKGKTLPNLDVLIKIAIRCNLHISYFFTEDSNSNVINQDIFNQVFKLAYKFAEKNNITINGSYFLACYDLVVNAMQKDNVDLETSFNNNKSIILKFMK